MPIYAFACLTCGHAFDNLQRMSDPDPTECPACGAPEVKRQLTAPSFRLAGAGWYETDFKKDGDRKRNIAGEGGDSKSADSGAASADAPAKSNSEGKSDAGPARPAASTGEAKPEPKPAAKSDNKPSSLAASKSTPKSGEAG